MSEFKGYSLWLAPSPSSPAYQHAGSLIKALAARYATSRFDPHVTLLSPIKATPDEIRAAFDGIRRSIDPGLGGKRIVRIGIKEIVTKPLHYQCVVLHVGGDNLQPLYDATELAFYGKKTPYFSHLSLVYGDLSEETRREIADYVERGEWFRDDTESDWRKALSFEADRVLIVDTSGRPEEWSIKGEIPL
ncbi:uncharacterized protein VTP21DRAFT_965 [Calcarisporiella thermophila]|uniref:uncharacterized protein n=1 Tax=Calcarisporiella thermophila TaxID=911321 RepID=UPI0037429F97